MANDKKEKQQGKPAQLWGRIKAWFRGMKSELKKVVWPTPKALRNNTLISIGMMLVSAVVIWVFDLIATGAVNGLFSIVG